MSLICIKETHHVEQDPVNRQCRRGRGDPVHQDPGGDGNLLRVETTERWKDNDGKAHFTAEIIAREMKMLGGERADILAPPEDDHEPPPTFSLTRRGIAQFIMAASKRSYMTTCTHMTTCLCRLIGAENA